MNRIDAATRATESRATKLDDAERQLEELLAILDQMEGCTIVALHVDQAINALRDVDRPAD